MKNLFIISLSVFNVKTNETTTLNYYFKSFDNAEKKLKELREECDNFTTFAGDWRHSCVTLSKDRYED